MAGSAPGDQHCRPGEPRPCGSGQDGGPNRKLGKDAEGRKEQDKAKKEHFVKILWKKTKQDGEGPKDGGPHKNRKMYWWCNPHFRPCGNGGDRLRRNLGSLPDRHGSGPCYGHKCDPHSPGPQNRNLGEIPIYSSNTVQVVAPIALVVAGAALYTYKWKMKHAPASKNAVSKEEQSNLEVENLA